MLTLFKKIALIILTSLLFLNTMVLPMSAMAAPAATTPATWYNQPFNEWYGKVYDPANPSEIFGERYTAAQVEWVVYGLFGFLINTVTGPQNADVVKCFLNNAVDLNSCASAFAKIADNAKVGNLAQDNSSQNQNIWSAVFADRPLSGISYVREKFGSLKLVPEVHAQTVGFGFNALNPVQGMWKAFRDIAFGLFVIVAVAFAFMIMFRVKLSPQTVISVQSALPKIVVALILVTFSYAIAGFLIDLMYVVIGLVSITANSIFKSVIGFGPGATPFFNLLTLGQIFGFNFQVGILGLMIVFWNVFFMPLLILLFVVGAPLLAIPGIGLVLYALFVVILFIVAVLILLWTGVKIIWSLLKAFVNIILLTIFAPIQFALGTIIPSLDFGQWLRSYASNLAVFVVTGTLFLFSLLFMILAITIGFASLGTSLVAGLLGPIFGTIALHVTTNPFTKSPAWPPLLGTGSEAWTGLIYLGVSFVLFTLVPKANEIIQGLLSGKPFAYGTAIGEAFGGVGLAYQQSGASDFVEAARIGRRLTAMERMFREGSPLREPAQRILQFVSGRNLDQTKSTLSGVIEHKK